MRKSIPVYASGGYCKLNKGVNEVEAITAEMQEHVNRGFSAAKIKMSGVDLKLDIERIKAAREVLGKQRALYRCKQWLEIIPTDFRDHK